MKFAPGTWHNDPLPRYNKFSPDGGGGSGGWDGTLGTFICQTVVNDNFAHSLRDLGQYGVSTKSVIGHPAWKTAVEKTMPFGASREGCAWAPRATSLGRPSFSDAWKLSQAGRARARVLRRACVCCVVRWPSQ